ncbi:MULTISPECIES: DNA primase [Cupriavidus]|uniref:DNA primase n=1 Tax=Cupriavidus TaxID=106589 RepID=UPI0018C8703E|nr:DNA primase [Cupriavidus metallidurans]
MQQTSKGRWKCICPAHDDKSPSLSVTEKDDGRVLVHCFGGCDSSEVLAAVGLDMSALFPERLADHLPRERRAFNAHDVLRGVVFELAIAIQFINMVRRGESLTEQHQERLRVCVERLAVAEGIANA